MKTSTSSLSHGAAGLASRRATGLALRGAAVPALRGPIVLAAALASVATADAQPCDDGPSGRLISAELNGQSLSEIDQSQIVVVRDNDRMNVAPGDPLCAGDSVEVLPPISAVLELGLNGDTLNSVTLIGQSRLTIESPTSIFSSIGRLFLRLRSSFTVRMPGGTLGARGTQFEVDTSGASRVVQLEGTVDFMPADGQGAVPVVVEPGQALALPQAGVAAASVSPLDRTVCADVLATNSAIVAATQPALPRFNRVRTIDPTDTANRFAAARTRFFCDADATALPDLAGAYAAWAETGGVLELPREIPGSLGVAAQSEYATSIADGLRLTGATDAAVEWYRRAVTLDDSFGPAHDGLGRALVDQAIRSVNPRRLATVDTALRTLDQAEAELNRALQRGMRGVEEPSARAAVMISLGDLSLARAELQPANGNRHLARATRFFELALQTTDRNAPFAELGLARVELMRADLVPETRIEGEFSAQVLVAQVLISTMTEKQRRPFRETARDILNSLLERYPDFSVGSQMLGEVYDELGDNDEAEARIRRAIRLDPNNTDAYRSLVSALPGRRNRRERQFYEAAFEAFTPPSYVTLVEQRQSVSRAVRPDPVIMDITALASSHSALKFPAPDPNGKTITFTNVGSQPVNVGQPMVTGANASVFPIRRQTCTNGALEPNAECTVTIAFTAQQGGSYSATLTVGGDANVATEVELSGEYEVFVVQ